VALASSEEAEVVEREDGVPEVDGAFGRGDRMMVFELLKASAEPRAEMDRAFSGEGFVGFHRAASSTLSA
jgi:hypothetical protein